MSEDTVNDDTSNVTMDDTSVSDTVTTDSTTDSTDDSVDVNQLQETNKKLYERAKKAEADLKTLKQQAVAKPESSLPKGDMSTQDLYAVIKANVPQDDIEDIKEYAAFKKISVAEALKSAVVKNLLADKEEQRKVASATNTGTVKRGSTKVSEEVLLSQASDGKLPDDPTDLALAKFRDRQNKRLKK